MKVVCDVHIPYIAEALRSIAEVIELEPEAITAEAVRDADGLIIRTRTKADSTLLDGSQVQFIATATIGYDHIDTAYCAEHNIHWVSCPGCNAQAVCDYIEEAFEEYRQITNMPKDKKLTIGIVGVGHVGSLVAKMAARKGYQVLLNDPPKNIGISLDEIADKCDFITFHTPLTKEGAYPTCHLCDRLFLAHCKPGALIVNAARGGVVDELALVESGHPFIIDTWEGEPCINRAVVEKAELASFHIAGYSAEGKFNASQMCLAAFCQHFGTPILSIDKKVVSLQAQYGDTAPGWLKRVSDQLKAAPDQFEQLRKQYKLR